LQKLHVTSTNAGKNNPRNKSQACGFFEIRSINYPHLAAMDINKVKLREREIEYPHLDATTNLGPTHK
jgi:hypothetical protein